MPVPGPDQFFGVEDFAQIMGRGPEADRRPVDGQSAESLIDPAEEVEGHVVDESQVGDQSSRGGQAQAALLGMFRERTRCHPLIGSLTERTKCISRFLLLSSAARASAAAFSA